LDTVAVALGLKPRDRRPAVPVKPLAHVAEKTGKGVSSGRDFDNSHSEPPLKVLAATAVCGNGRA
jgi:hypothetical protein